MTNWNKFETYKGPKKKEFSPRLEKIIVRTGIVVGLLIGGSLGGIYFIICLVNESSAEFLVKASMKEYGCLFGIGVIVSIVKIIQWYNESIS